MPSSAASKSPSVSPDGPSVADCFRFEGGCLVGVAGGGDLSDLGGFDADLVSEFEGGGFASEALSEGKCALC